MPDHFGFLWGTSPSPAPEATEGVAPFHVLGLQQMVLERQLALHVAVTPVDGVSQGGMPGKVAKKAKVSKGGGVPGGVHRGECRARAPRLAHA